MCSRWTGIPLPDDETVRWAEPAVAQQIEIRGRRYWVLSEPAAAGWRAWVIEVLDDGGRTDEVGIEATAETRGAADVAAERKLRRLLGVD